MLKNLNVLQLGAGLSAAVTGRAFADLGADVHCLGAMGSTPLSAYLNHAKSIAGDTIDAAALEKAAASAALIVCEGGPSALRDGGCDPETLRALNPQAVIVAISPFGQTGPRADEPATDLTLFCASGVARMLTGQVDDLAEPPTRAVGEQSAFIGGLAGATAGMHGLLAGKAGVVIDVSVQEALATLAMRELSRAGAAGKSWTRKRIADGNGATVTILPAADGFVAISPREEHQWTAWIAVMGSPTWAADVRFKTKPDRVSNWGELHGLMSDWTRTQSKQAIADAAQAAHVPSFPLMEVSEHLNAEQLHHRGFFRSIQIDGETLEVPGPAYGLQSCANQNASVEGATVIETRAMPLSGVRVLDFSWVIAGPTTTRYMAAMGAEIIKVEAPGKGDPARRTGLHTVLGQGKRGIVLNLKSAEGVEAARALAAKCDIVIENFGTGVMERFGLGADELRRVNPRLIYISASGMGRTGPQSNAVAYGTLLQCYAGFAALNRQPDTPPRVGLAWLDPMCALKLSFVAAAALWQRERTGEGARIDFSMLEAMLWTMAEPVLKTQRNGSVLPLGNASDLFAPHGLYPADGSAAEDRWVSIAVTTDAQWRALCAVIPDLSQWREADLDLRRTQGAEIERVLSEWTRPQKAEVAARTLVDAGIPAASLATMPELVDCEHLRVRNFWEDTEAGRLPGLPWQSTLGRCNSIAPGHGADTDTVLREVLELNDDEIAKRRMAGAFG
jgi:crotonobetainyl-CoA:carnitine CoA-transferase CaiB-like acyl-CoA transferase